MSFDRLLMMMMVKLAQCSLVQRTITTVPNPCLIRRNTVPVPGTEWQPLNCACLSFHQPRPLQNLTYRHFRTGTWRESTRGNACHAPIACELLRRRFYVSAEIRNILSNKNPSSWYFVRPAQAAKCGTVAIIIRVVLLSPYLCIRGVSLSSIHYNKSRRVYVNRRQQYICLIWN